MGDISKYRGIIPAFYACHDDKEVVSPERVEELTCYMVRKGVKGLCVGGSSGERIYQSVSEHRLVLEYVAKVAEGELTIIAHVGCNNTAGSMELAAHAQNLGMDTIASIPPICFHPPEYTIAEYWNSISSAAPGADFVIYNIPQLIGVALTMSLFYEMLKSPRVMVVKGSSMPVQDIQMFEMNGGEGFMVFSSSDEQLVSGLAVGTDGGIGGTYGVVPELYIKVMEPAEVGDALKARGIQNVVDGITYKMCSCKGNLHAAMREISNIHEGLKPGSVRKSTPGLMDNDMPCVRECADMISEAIEKYR